MRRYFVMSAIVPGSVLFTAVFAAETTGRQTRPPAIPTVSYCELTRTQDAYDQKVIRVRAVYYRGFEQSYLHDTVCVPGSAPATSRGLAPETWVSFDASLKTEGDSDEAKRNRAAMDWGRMDITAVGRFKASRGESRFGHLGCCRFEFVVLKVESVIKLPREQ